MVCLQCLVSLLQEVEALFKSENCPEVLSAKFAHNSNWYITFQSDMDAQKVCVSFNHSFGLSSVVMGVLFLSVLKNSFVFLPFCPSGIQVSQGGSESVPGKTNHGEFCCLYALYRLSNVLNHTSLVLQLVFTAMPVISRLVCLAKLWPLAQYWILCVQRLDKRDVFVGTHTHPYFLTA